MAYPNGLPRWCAYWCTPRKYRPKQVTIKELKSKMRSRKEKKLSYIIIPKNCEFQLLKANFLEELLWFLFCWASCISKCRFSKYFKGFFSKYFEILKDQENNFVNKTWTFFLSFNMQKSPKTDIFSLSLLIGGIKIRSDYDEIWLLYSIHSLNPIVFVIP